MRGFVVIGTSFESGELRVAARLCDAATRAGLRPAALIAAAAGRSAKSEAAALARAAGLAEDALAVRAFELPAPPAIAARHLGVPLEPAAVLEAARAAAEGADVLVVVSSGGLLGPLALRYTNRDLARELGLPLVVAAEAGDGLLNHAMLTLESAAGAGTPVASVVITGWPEPPGRVLLDEREMLAEAALVPAVMLEDWERWPLADWLEKAAVPEVPAPDEPQPRHEVRLEPHRAWEERPVGDPRATPRPQIMATLLEIVGVEGPMTATRAYSLYNRAAGGRKLTSVARAPLSSAVYWLANESKIVLVRKDDIPWQGDDLVRMPDSPAVRVRELGPRALEEVPLDEIAELMTRLRAARGISDATGLKRAVLDCYGLVRLTTRADEYLGLAVDLAGSA